MVAWKNKPGGLQKQSAIPVNLFKCVDICYSTPYNPPHTHALSPPPGLAPCLQSRPLRVLCFIADLCMSVRSADKNLWQGCTIL